MILIDTPKGASLTTAPPILAGEINRWYDGEFVRILTSLGTDCSDCWESVFLDRVDGMPGPRIRFRRCHGWKPNLVQWEVQGEHNK